MSPRELLYGTVPRVNNTCPCTKNFTKKVDLMSNVPVTKNIINKEVSRKCLEGMDLSMALTVVIDSQGMLFPDPSRCVP